MRYVPLLVCLLGGCVGPDHSLGEFLTPDEFHLFYTDGEGDNSGTSATGGAHDPWRRYGVNSGESDYSAWTAGLTWNLTAPSSSKGLREAARAMQISARLMADAANASRSAPEPVMVLSAPAIDVEAPEAPEPFQVVVEAAAPVAVAPVVIEVGGGGSEPTVLTLPPSLEAALLALVSRAASAPVAAPADSGDPVVIVQPGAAPDITITVENEQAASVEDNDQGADPEPAGGGSDPDEPQGVTLLGISSEVWTQLLVALGLLATAVAGYLGREKIPGVKELTKKGKAERAEKKAAEAEESE